MRLMFSVLTLAACLLMAYPAAAQSCGGGDGCGVGAVDSCGHCGARVRCQRKTVQVVCDVKKIKQICWAVECESFRPSIPVGYGKKPNCDPCGTTSCGTTSCGSCGGHGFADRRVPGLTPACGSGKCRVKKKLMMREIEIEVPIYRAEVRYLCPTCCGGGHDSGCGGVPVEENAAPIPAPDQQAVRIVPLPTS